MSPQSLLAVMENVFPTTTVVTIMMIVETIVMKWTACSDPVTPIQSSHVTMGVASQRTMFAMALTTAMTTGPLMSRTAVSMAKNVKKR